MLQHFIQHFIQNFIENKCFKLKKVKQIDYDYHYEVECFICFMPYEQNNPIKMLSEFPYIIQKCKCNTNIHLLCLTNWIRKTQSCPICRTKITYFSLLEPKEVKLQKNSIKYILYINAFIVLSFNLCLCIYIFIQVLFEIYLYIKL